MTTDLEHIAQEITALKYDIKTEVLVSDNTSISKKTSVL